MWCTTDILFLGVELHPEIFLANSTWLFITFSIRSLCCDPGDGGEKYPVIGAAKYYSTTHIQMTGVEGLALRFRQRVNVTTGDVVATTTADVNGEYTVHDLPYGNLTCEIVRAGIDTSFANVISVLSAKRSAWLQIHPLNKK